MDKCLAINKQVQGNQPAGLKSVSTGGHGTWATDANDEVWYVRIDNGNWQKVNGGLKQVSVSSDRVWGVNKNGNIYYSTGRAPSMKWNGVSGGLVYISASEKGNVYGINKNDNIYQRTANSWRQLPGLLVQISSGPSGVWGVNKHDEIYYLPGTYGDTGKESNKWVKIDGALKWIKSGHGYVYGVNAANEAWIRYTSLANPTGGTWYQMHTQHFEL